MPSGWLQRRPRFAVCLLACSLCISGRDARSTEQPRNLDRLASEYQQEVRPLILQYCRRCHSSKRSEGDINLEALDTWAHVRKNLKTWQKVREMLDSGQMPPPEARQPTADQRARLKAWADAYLGAEAMARAGDPGPVVLRRLSNAEYTFTLRDLTNLAALEPAREFPVDGAAGEGFTNTGNALVMSPALLGKYLGAAKDVSRHAVLLPDGFRFSPHTTRRDWTNAIVQEIRDFYRQFTDSSGGTRVNLQGIVWETNQGGRLPVEKYLSAVLVEREPLRAGRKNIETVARERGLNPRYLAALWKTLTSKEPSLLLDGLRTRWRVAGPSDSTALAGLVAAWQKELWRFTTVGHIGKVGGPKKWQESVNPIFARQEIRFKLPTALQSKEVTFSLVASNVGIGSEEPVVVWQQPRLVAPGKPDLLLRDVRGVIFGKYPESGPVDGASICTRAPSIITVRLPADVAAGCEVVTTGLIGGANTKEGAVQLRVLPDAPASDPGFQPGTPIVVNEGTIARKRLESGFEEFRRLFPAALCYSRIVPVDEVITLTLFYREDDHLTRLMLDETQRAKLDRLWDELRYVSQDALTLVDALAQLLEYASQDADPKVFFPLRKPIQENADAFRQRLIDTQPRHLNALLEFADQAYRRPLAEREKEELRRLYHKLRQEGMEHEEAFRLTLARILVAPPFLYRVEQPGAGTEQSPVSDWELASRLSYFLWSTQPDAELRCLAAAGRLHETDTLIEQAQRMLGNQRIRHLATEFACQWLHIYDFDRLDEKSERHFPTFAGLRGAMYEESIQFFTDLFQRGGSVLDILDADYTFLNEALAKHYGIPGITGPEWRLVDGVKQFARGGILAQATTLAKQSGASRTSPILRGNWISEVLLGERLPRPPKDVPRLPEDESATSGLTVRQLVEKHTSDPKCAVCHQRIDAFGFSLEGFDAIGRRRDKDLGDRPIDTRVKTMDGAQFADIDGLQRYLATTRQQAFLRQFCRKLLGYALGRAVQLSDQPLLAEMERKLQANHFSFAVAVETIVASRQFREIRGRLAVAEN